MIYTFNRTKISRKLPVIAAVMLVLLCVAPAQADYSKFTAMREVSSRNLAPFSKWTSVQKRFQSQLKKLEKESCEGDQCQLAEWQALLKEASGKSARAQLDMVHRFFNQVKYIEDADNYSKSDYWATPFEMLSRGGDCEDYAIAKYLALRKLGVAESAMRIMIVQDNNLGGIMHAVLEVKLGGERYLLDNQASRVVEEDSVHHYLPIYALNGREWWAFKS